MHLIGQTIKHTVTADPPDDAVIVMGQKCR